MPSATPLARQFQGVDARILLVEDNLTNQKVAVGILGKLGLVADVANNGWEAIQALAARPYGLVLMDVQMPVMDGIEATRQIRASLAPTLNPRIPIVAMTAHALSSDRNKCIEAGMSDYLSKPVNPKELAETLRRWLPCQEGSAAMPLENEITKPIAKASIVFDREGMMSRLMDDEDLMRAVVVGFLGDMPGQIATLRGFVDLRDAKGIESKGHSIKGAAANVGGEALRALASAMEIDGRSGNLDAVAARMDEMEIQFLRLRDAMTESK
jgi:CheY-like chemotaxis protein/HPt (histidine-containing phosphotransfer) domain-containing protein